MFLPLFAFVSFAECTEFKHPEKSSGNDSFYNCISERYTRCQYIWLGRDWLVMEREEKAQRWRESFWTEPFREYVINWSQHISKTMRTIATIFRLCFKYSKQIIQTINHRRRNEHINSFKNHLESFTIICSKTGNGEANEFAFRDKDDRLIENWII